MNTESEHHGNAQAVFSAISDNDTWTNSGGYHRAGLWWGYLASSVALAAVGESIQYVGLGGEQVENSFDLHGVAFTESRVISFTVKAEKGADEADFTVTTRALSSLVEYDAKTLIHPSTEGYFTWPGNPSAELRFRDGWSCSLPLTPIRNQEQRDALVALLRKVPSHLS